MPSDAQDAMTDEEFVRSAWEWVRERFSEPHEGYAQGVYVIEMPMRKFSHKDLTVAWSAAAAFTRDLLEEIRQLREEIDFMEQMEYTSGLAKGAICARILARLEAELARLTAGMKKEKV